MTSLSKEPFAPQAAGLLTFVSDTIGSVTSVDSQVGKFVEESTVALVSGWSGPSFRISCRNLDKNYAKIKLPPITLPLRDLSPFITSSRSKREYDRKVLVITSY